MSRSQKNSNGSRKLSRTEPNDLSLNLSHDKKKNIIFFKKTGMHKENQLNKSSIPGYNPGSTQNKNAEN